MQDTSIFRQILDNWTLVYLFILFVGICLWVIFGRSKSYRDTSELIFRHDDKPAADRSSAMGTKVEEARR